MGSAFFRNQAGEGSSFSSLPKNPFSIKENAKIFESVKEFVMPKEIF
jgi:hypothetical protein